MAANDNDKPSAWFKRVNKRLDTLDSNMDSLYQTTYSSRSDNKNDMENIVTSIDDTVDRIINNGQSPKISDISNLYTRLQKKQGISNTQVINSAMELFADNTIISSLSMSEDLTKAIQAEDYQYDMICKYMPSIETALDIKRDNVLSSDNFSKDFLNIVPKTTTNFEVFNGKIIRCKDKYKFQDICEEMYDRAAKYGEAFVYIVPYDVAIQRLLDRRTQFSGTGLIRTFSESGTAKRAKNTQPRTISIIESSKTDKELAQQLQEANIKLDGECQVNLIFDDYAIYSEAVETQSKANSAMAKGKSVSLTEAYNILQESGDKEVSSVKWDSVYKDHKGSDTLDGGVNDGLIVNGTKGANPGKGDKVDELRGAVIDFIDRADILPIYMDNLCVGYYYFMFSELNDMNCCRHGNPMGYGYGSTTGLGTNQNMAMDNSEMASDMLLSFIAQKISDNIDAHFINANKDLKEEIYSILKYNDKFSVMNGVNNITVAFLPADDVYHFYLKQDRKTHRGISSIRKSLVPAMLYCLLYLTTTIGQVTRGQDKRVYYVKQNVETNVARTLMNVINQIKRGNMGMRQIQSMNSILGIVGKYNDFVIPMGQSGDAPIQFEVMQGQDIQTPSELLDRFENQAVEGTDVPYEFVQSVNQVDYATRFTMSNSKFLRKVYKEQRICQEAFTAIFTKLYNYEYGEAEKEIRVLLPAPAFLSMTNTQQLIENTRNYVNAITESELGSDDDAVKNEFTRLMMRNNLGSYIDYGKVDECITQARLNVDTKDKKDEE